MLEKQTALPKPTNIGGVAFLAIFQFVERLSYLLLISNIFFILDGLGGSLTATGDSITGVLRTSVMLLLGPIFGLIFDFLLRKRDGLWLGPMFTSIAGLLIAFGSRDWIIAGLIFCYLGVVISRSATYAYTASIVSKQTHLLGTMLLFSFVMIFGSILGGYLGVFFRENLSRFVGAMLVGAGLIRIVLMGIGLLIDSLPADESRNWKQNLFGYLSIVLISTCAIFLVSMVNSETGMGIYQIVIVPFAVMLLLAFVVYFGVMLWLNQPEYLWTGMVLIVLSISLAFVASFADHYREKLSAVQGVTWDTQRVFMELGGILSTIVALILGIVYFFRTSSKAIGTSTAIQMIIGLGGFLIAAILSIVLPYYSLLPIEVGLVLNLILLSMLDFLVYPQIHFGKLLYFPKNMQATVFGLLNSIFMLPMLIMSHLEAENKMPELGFGIISVILNGIVVLLGLAVAYYFLQKRFGNNAQF